MDLFTSNPMYFILVLSTSSFYPRNSCNLVFTIIASTTPLYHSLVLHPLPNLFSSNGGVTVAKVLQGQDTYSHDTLYLPLITFIIFLIVPMLLLAALIYHHYLAYHHFLLARPNMTLPMGLVAHPNEMENVPALCFLQKKDI